MLDGNDEGHFISVPNHINRNFSHVKQTSESGYKTFDYMLLMHQTMWPDPVPLVLPKGVDIEAAAFLHNMGIALGRDFNAIELETSLDQQMRPSYMAQGQIDLQPRLSFVFQKTQIQNQKQ